MTLRISSRNIGRKKSEVGIHHSYTRYLPFSTDSKRTKNWSEYRDIDVKGEKFTLEMTGMETVNYHDFRTLLTLIYYAQEHPLIQQIP